MKFLHLADLHLGRLFHEQSLIEDQKYLLNQLVDILSRDRYSAILLAGDIYDRSIPSAEAVSLLGDFLNTLHSRFPDTAICMIAGNHDSPERLAFGHELFRSMNIHIVSDPNLSFEPVIVTDGKERCAVFLLPFLYPGSLYSPKEAPNSDNQESGAAPQGLRTQQSLAAEAGRRLEERRKELAAQGIHHSVLVGHLFTQGGRESESERIFVGTAEQVDVRLFSGFSYVALGHLHRCQQAGPNAWYAGSPLAYSFGEAGQEKVCLEVEIPACESGQTATVRAIPLKPLHPVRRLKALFADLMSGNLQTEKKGTQADALVHSYLEIELTDEHLVENAQLLLEQRYPLVLSVKQDRAFQALVAERSALQGMLPDTASGGTGRRRGTLDDFIAFQETLYGQVDQGKLDLFATLLKEQQSHETP
ncbi:MAG: exonuclease subunit SbcD [Treponema sp.]|nr:exonuclease subunit SbcD [Treponema sp.]